MITLCIIGYVIFSLVKSDRYYWEPYFGLDPSDKNPAYLNRKFSLFKGFTFLPFWIGIVASSLFTIYWIIKGMAIIIGWTLVNMP